MSNSTCGIANPGGSPCTKPKGHDGGHDLAAYGSLTNIPILDDDAVAKIEALSAKVPEGPWFVDKDDAEDVPDHRRSGLALVDTGRSADWWIARLCEWHTARFIAESKTNVDALCQTVRALRAENERAINVLVTAHNDTVAALQSQLEQVTKERDDYRRRLKEWEL